MKGGDLSAFYVNASGGGVTASGGGAICENLYATLVSRCKRRYPTPVSTPTAFVRRYDR
ncbi:hypothetical protein KCP74_21700 [Salmonella enterica subsp. enterica]|nr:hypothetical protein KCP74_21700 [Salmonella enterica subsp. enterica]